MTGSGESVPYGASRPRLLDLFCCEGGAAKGYWRAGFYVVGVDIEPQPRYVGDDFVQMDAIQLLERLPLWEQQFDAIHASPPCQHYSDLAKRNGNADEWPDLIPRVRELCEATGLPYVIENVEGAPLRDPVTLCGTMFPTQWKPCSDPTCERCKGAGEYPTGGGYTRAWVPCLKVKKPGLRVIRHRLFETNWHLTTPAHRDHPLVFTHDKRKAHHGKLDQDTSFVQVTGGGNATLANKRDAMGMPWATNHGLNEAIPPAYTEWIGWQLALTLRADEELLVGHFGSTARPGGES